jgi:hypothetical protein
MKTLLILAATVMTAHASQFAFAIEQLATSTGDSGAVIAAMLHESIDSPAFQKRLKQDAVILGFTDKDEIVRFMELATAEARKAAKALND